MIRDRYKGRYPYKGEAGKDAAKRIMEELGEYDPKDTGAGSNLIIGSHSSFVSK